MTNPWFQHVCSVAGTHLLLMELVERSCINGDHLIFSYKLYALYSINIVRVNIPLNSIW